MVIECSSSAKLGKRPLEISAYVHPSDELLRGQLASAGPLRGECTVEQQLRALPGSAWLVRPIRRLQDYNLAYKKPMKSCGNTSARLLPGANPRLVMNWGSASISSVQSAAAMSSRIES
jgi:hypothetical protein